MRNTVRSSAALALAAMLFALPAAAQERGDWVNVRNARVAAPDVAAAATFYKSVFGMQEIQRYERPGFLEVILNFGRTAEEAKAAPTTRIALITRRPDQPADGVSNLVLNVGDMDKVVARVTAAGGAIEKPPTRSAASGNVIAMVRESGASLFDIALERPLAIAIGNEGAGLSQALVDASSVRATIPMPGAVESLNAAAAAAVALFECVRRVRETG